MHIWVRNSLQEVVILPFTWIEHSWKNKQLQLSIEICRCPFGLCVIAFCFRLSFIFFIRPSFFGIGLNDMATFNASPSLITCFLFNFIFVSLINKINDRQINTNSFGSFVRSFIIIEISAYYRIDSVEWMFWTELCYMETIRRLMVWYHW